MCSCKFIQKEKPKLAWKGFARFLSQLEREGKGMTDKKWGWSRDSKLHLCELFNITNLNCIVSTTSENVSATASLLGVLTSHVRGTCHTKSLAYNIGYNLSHKPWSWLLRKPTDFNPSNLASSNSFAPVHLCRHWRLVFAFCYCAGR